MSKKDSVEPQEPTTETEIEGAVSELYGELLDQNQEVMQGLREHVERLRHLQQRFLDQAARIDDIITLTQQAGVITAESFGDILVNEWGISIEEDDDDDEQEGADV